MLERAANSRFTLLPPLTLTAAISGQASTARTGLAGMKWLALETIFVYGSGGTDAKVWIQTSLDGGTTWFDIASCVFAQTSTKKLQVVRIDPASDITPATVPGDAALTDDTVLHVLGDRLRTKVTSTGTYGGSTTLAVYAVAKG